MELCKNYKSNLQFLIFAVVFSNLFVHKQLKVDDSISFKQNNIQTRLLMALVFKARNKDAVVRITSQCSRVFLQDAESL
jgi:hypothetical protein